MKLVFYLGFLFWGGGFLIGFCHFFLYNGFGNMFEYVKADNAEINYEITFLNKVEITDITYSYIVNKKLYESKESISNSAIERRGVHIDEIYYNSNLAFLSYVGDKELSLKKAKTEMIISGIPFIFFFLMYKFADMDKWIGIYTRGEYKSSKKRQ